MRECAERWGVRVRWLEYRRRYLPAYKSEVARVSAARSREATGRVAVASPPGVVEPGYVEVDFATASRAGEPFQNFIDMSGLPNSAGRRCTTELKIRVMKRFMLDQGYEHWDNVVGIRADEPDRVRNLRKSPPERWEHVLPLADAGIFEEDVLAFWRSSEFDLGLRHDPELGTYQGNCDLCFMKSTEKKVRVVRDEPNRAEWWERQERATGSFFRTNMTYARVRRLAVVGATCPADDGLGDCFCHD